jgi:transposase-like protein
VSPSTVSDLNKKIYVTIEVRRNRPIEGEHPYVYLNGLGRTSYQRATSATLAFGP